MIEALKTLLAGNPFFQGGLSLMFIGAILAAIRYAPSLLWTLLWRWFGVVIVVRNATMVYWLGVWLSEHEVGKQTHWLEATTMDGKEGLAAVLRPGPGVHTFIFQNRRFYLEHELEDAGMAGKINVMTLRILRPDRAVVSALIQDVADRANDERVGRTPVYVNTSSGYWHLLRLIPKRASDTIFLGHGQLEDIFSDADWFFRSEDWYRKRGVPYRRGYLLHGEPGNGKSSLTQALAAHCDTSVYLLSLADDEFKDASLMQAMGQVPPHSLVVLEDFDKADWSQTSVTMPGLLNAIDGSIASEARIFIITANDASQISETMLRPGRIDRKWHIGMPAPEAIDACLTRFGVDGQYREIAAQAKALNWTMAELQSELWVCYDLAGRAAKEASREAVDSDSARNILRPGWMRPGPPLAGPLGKQSDGGRPVSTGHGRLK